MKRNLVGKILGKIKIFVQDFIPIRTALTSTPLYSSRLCAENPVFEIVQDQVNNGVLYFLDYVEDIYIMGPLRPRFNVVTSSSQPM